MFVLHPLFPSLPSFPFPSFSLSLSRSMIAPSVRSRHRSTNERLLRQPRHTTPLCHRHRVSQSAAPAQHGGNRRNGARTRAHCEATRIEEEEEDRGREGVKPLESERADAVDGTAGLARACHLPLLLSRQSWLVPPVCESTEEEGRNSADEAID